MSAEKLNSLLTAMKENINIIDSNIQEIFLKRLNAQSDEQYANFTSEINDLNADEISNEIAPVVDFNEDQFFVPKNIPKFKNGFGSIQDIDEFIVVFENCLASNGLNPSTHGARLITNCLSFSDLQWLQNRVPNNSTWTEIVPHMKEIFGDPEKEARALNQLWNSKMYHNETITEF
ncbi:hypothetical protein AYI69_g5371, partial [Smittium culicis]